MRLEKVADVGLFVILLVMQVKACFRSCERLRDLNKCSFIGKRPHVLSTNAKHVEFGLDENTHARLGITPKTNKKNEHYYCET